MRRGRGIMRGLYTRICQRAASAVKLRLVNEWSSSPCRLQIETWRKGRQRFVSLFSQWFWDSFVFWEVSTLKFLKTFRKPLHVHSVLYVFPTETRNAKRFFNFPKKSGHMRFRISFKKPPLTVLFKS